VKLVLVGALVALIIGLVGTRYFISLAKRKGWGQFVRDDGPTSHHTKRGTPQMGGLVIIASSVVGYALGDWCEAAGFGGAGFRGLPAEGPRGRSGGCLR
jgi:UDP-N-acetylmuramyl pentapeptide phosphotransferase/UDP-N-acetylglucosamine-1-phosphate transferase